MPTSFNKERTVDRAADAVRAQILGGAFPSGTRLPPERTLAASLGINRLTLRAALARLEAEGLVRPRQGAGYLVLDYHRTASLELVGHLADVDDLSLVAPFLELRRIIGGEAVALASERASETDLARLAELAELQENETDADAFTERDLEFGRAVLEAAGNPAMQLLLNSIESVYRAMPVLGQALLRNRAMIVASYRTVITLIEDGDPDRARTVIRRALKAIDGEATRLLDRHAR